MNYANMNDCQVIRDHLSAYMDGELDNDMTAKVHEHLCDCTECSMELSEFKRLGDFVNGTELAAGSVSSHAERGLPAWDVFATRLGDSNMPHAAVSKKMSGTELATGSASENLDDAKSTSVRRQHWKAVSGVLAALAASLVLMASLWQPANDQHSATSQASVVTLNLQPVLESFGEDSKAALDHLASQFVTKDVSLDRANDGLGRPTFVSLASHRQSLPGDARVSTTKVMSFPFCQCPDGECACGPDGCSCVACVCERPDGTSYLVLEHCKSQSVSFGDLPVQLVHRDGKEFQRVLVDGSETISFDGPSGRITAVGLRGETEVNTLLASM